ncbi:hypothetical protein A6A06_16155 [Streptomyces sp. CB02923]|uniref:phosphotransferase n=1 Tax=Streptomyces sp. CB02923 TaxID=1718985 RepID=UPI00093F1C7C|nr:phosphotransferase [Streptomyces sp. CB02923]OKI02548.1 hypothetical protein A6A06_16155 [Streptomyces sp. CB02923]
MPVREKPIRKDFFNLDERAMGIISDRYRLADVDCFLPILVDGNRCTLLEVRSETSKKVIVECGDARYFFKQIPWYCDTDEQVAMSTALQQELGRAGVPVARLVATGDGRLWTSIHDERFVLFEFSNGRRYEGRPQQTRAAAGTLARLHAAEVVVPGAPGEDVFSIAYDHIQLLETVWGKQDRDAAPVAGAYRAFLRRAEGRAGAAGFGGLPAVAVHGDYNPWNLLFADDDQVQTVLDFDNCDVAARLHDVAEAVLTFCVLAYREDSTNFARTQPDAPDAAAISAFLSAYQAVSPLTGTEKKCLPWALGAVFVELTCLGFIRDDFGPDHLPALVRLLDRLVAAVPDEEAAR